MTNKKQGGEGGGGSGGVSSSTTQLVSSPRKKCGKCVGAGGGGVVDRSNFKKGPWTAEEDALLMEYVKNHGERHWNCVQKTGLMRCGKSCRLRWTNHLRPDLKKGAFKPEEERIVLDLHAKLGNKWSKIAAELPGRTDNEVKNFWNTKIKRRMKAKLPVQPEAKQQQQQHQIKATSAPFHFDYQQHKNHQYFPHHHQIRRDPTSTHSLPSSPSLYTSLFSPTSIPKSSLIETPPPGVLSTYGVQQQQDLTMPALNLMSSTTQNDPILSFLNNPAYNKFKFFGEDELKMRFSSATPVSRFAMPISSAPPPIYSSSIRSPSLISSMPSPIQFHAGNDGGVNLTLQTDNSGVQIDQQSGIANELPSFQIANMTENSPSSAGNYMQQQQQGTSGSSTGAGLSNDILQESWSCVLQQTSDAEKSAGMMDQTTCSFPMGNDPASYDNHLGVSSSGDQSHAHHTSTGMMQKKGSIADMAAPMDDDLPSLLDTFSSIGSPPEWYLTNTAAAAGRPMSISSTGNTVLDLDHNEAAAHTSLPNAAASSTTEFDWSLGTSSWNNMHGIS